MPSPLDIVQQALATPGAVLRFVYDGQERVFEARDWRHGVDGAPHVLGYQQAGGSNSGGIPEWRRFDVGRMQRIRLIIPAEPPEDTGRRSLTGTAPQLQNTLLGTVPGRSGPITVRRVRVVPRKTS